jgi:Na+-driven multidrug efflux pump
VALRRTLVVASFANLFLVLFGAGILWLFSDRLLHLLASDEIARSSAQLLPLVLAGPVLLALSVTGSYVMVALGRVRTVAMVNVLASLAVVIVSGCFLRSYGVTAIAAARIAFALIALSVYVPLVRQIRWPTRGEENFAAGEAVEGA